jgi:hypothetical protein
VALKRVCDITGTDRDVEICDVTIAGQMLKLDLSPGGADKLREFFGPAVTVQHPLAPAVPEDGGPIEPAVETAPEPVKIAVDEAEQIPAPAPVAEPSARRTRKISAVKPGRGKAAAQRGSKAAPQETSDIREWARANGFEIGDRGAIPGRIRSAYVLAHE